MDRILQASDFDALKQKMQDEPDLGAFWDYYFDHFAENQNYLTRGRTCGAAILLEKIEVITRHVFGKTNPKISGMHLKEIPEFQLIHGGCMVEGAIVSVVYFRDIEMGVMGIADFTRTMRYARFARGDLERMRAATGTIQ